MRCIELIIRLNRSSEQMSVFVDGFSVKPSETLTQAG